MGRLIVIEGIDGAGKRTLADVLRAAFDDRGARVAGVAFPRYGRSVAADLVRDALYRRVGDLHTSVHGMAALYAWDREGARPELERALAEHDVVLLDRYAASNAAYGAARLREGADGPFAAWIEELEFGRVGLPRPHAHVLLRVPAEVAGERARGRAATDATRARDSFEADDGLQERCADVYDGLAARAWAAPWHVLDGATTTDPTALATALLA